MNLQTLTEQELNKELRKINKHRIHAVRYHPTVQDYLETKAKEMFQEYQRRKYGN